jgi:hypothetical protein
MKKKYINFLKHKIFKTDEYDQFNLLLESVEEFVANYNHRVAIMERSYIYGGRSLFAPLVSTDSKPVVIDYRPDSADARVNYQGSWIDESGFQFQNASETILDLGTGYQFSFKKLGADSLLIPNVLHHCRDFPSLIEGLQTALPNLRRVYIFDSYLREGHQAPDDYCRYTPSALELVMRKLGFGKVTLRETGNIFDGLLYLISQAQWQLENAPELNDLRILIDEIVPRLRSIRHDVRYRSLGRPHAFLTTAYAMSFER